MLSFSLVSTVFNEAQRLEQTIADVEAQTLLPNEIVITDAGSTDGTWELLQKWKSTSAIAIVLLQEQKCNVSRGRNLAIQAASHSIIASTDFGCRFQAEWLQELLQPFSDESIEVVGGAFSILSHELPTLAAQSDYVLQNGYPVVLDEHFSTSSRSIAYRKYVWEKIGGYEEWLTLAADDTIFWRLILQHNFTYAFARQPRVAWLRHRSFSAFAKEAYRYGLGDGESGINSRNTISHLIETSLRYTLFALLVFAPLFIYTQSSFVLLLMLPSVAGLRSYRNAFRNWKTLPKQFSVRVLFGAFYLTELSRKQYLKGYVKGYFFSSSEVKKQRSELQKKLSSSQNTH